MTHNRHQGNARKVLNNRMVIRENTSVSKYTPGMLTSRVNCELMIETNDVFMFLLLHNNVKLKICHTTDIFVFNGELIIFPEKSLLLSALAFSPIFPYARRRLCESAYA